MRSKLVLPAALLSMALAPAVRGIAAEAAVDPSAAFERLADDEARRDDVYKVHVPDAQMARRAAITFHEQLLETDTAAGTMIMELSPTDKKRIEAFGFVVERADDWLERRARRLERLKQRGGVSLLGAEAPVAAGPDDIEGFPCYGTVEETFDAARAIAARFPSLASVVDAGASWQKTQGSGGYDILVLKLTNSAVPGPKPKLFVNSAIHAREYATAPLVLEFAKRLVRGYGNDADATWILDHHEIHLMLQTNPDGRKMAETGLLWRKNVNTAYCSRFPSERGADLNRNFAFDWNTTHGLGSSGQQCDETYRGASGGSEPETDAVQNYVRSLWPDRRGPGLDDAAPADTSGIHIDVHSYSELVLWPWGIRAAPAPNGAALQTLGRRLAWFNGYTPMQSWGLYPTDGTSDAVSYGELGVAAFAFEIGTDFFQSCDFYRQDILPKNLPALLYAAKTVRTPYLTAGGPEVTEVHLSGDAATLGVAAGAAVKLRAAATDVRFNDSEGIEATQNIDAAEYYVDTPPWLPGAVARPLRAADGRFDTTTEEVSGDIRTASLSKGRHLVYVRARDASATWGPFSASFLVIR